MPWQGPISGVTHDIVELCLAVCRLHELMREHVWKIRMLFILNILSQVVISHICFTNVDSTWRQDICTQLARTWDTKLQDVIRVSKFLTI